MPVEFALDCKFPNDLEAAFLEMEQTMSQRILDNQLLLANLQNEIVASNVFPALDEIQEIVEGLMRQGGGELRDFASLAGVYGLPVFAGTTDAALEPGLTNEVAAQREAKQLEADEKMIFNAGGVLHDGVWYLNGENSDLPSDQTNVEVLRNIYNASGRDLDKVNDILEEIRKQTPEGILGGGSYRPILFQSKLVIEKIPSINNGFTFVPTDSVRDRFGLPEFQTGDEVIYVAPQTNVTYVLDQSFLATNRPKALIEKESGVQDFDLITQTFHPNKKELRPERIREVSELGYSSQESGVVFRFKQFSFPDSVINDAITNNQNAASTIVQLIDFFAGRIPFEPRAGSSVIKSLGIQIPGQLTTLAKSNLENKIRSQLQELVKAHRKSITDILFEVFVIKDIDILLNLRSKHSDEEISRLLSKRPEIKGINFNATISDISKDMDRVKNGSALPNTKVSSNVMKANDTKETFNVQVLLGMYAELDQAIDLINSPDPITVSNLSSIKLNLTNYGVKADEAVNSEVDKEPPIVPYQGQDSGSVSTNMTKRINIEDTFGLQKIFDDIDKALTLCVDKGTLASIAAGIKSLSGLLRKVFGACQKLLDSAKIFFVWIAKLDSWLRNLVNLFGAGSFDLSLLNCISLNFEFPDFLKIIIDNLICFVASLLNGILALSTDWIADIIQSILCFPISVLNALLNKLNKYLPRCFSFNFDICDELIALLQDLALVGDKCSSNFESMGGELGSMSLSLGNLSDKVNGFGGGANCAQPANKFLNSLTLG